MSFHNADTKSNGVTDYFRNNTRSRYTSAEGKPNNEFIQSLQTLLFDDKRSNNITRAHIKLGAHESQLNIYAFIQKKGIYHRQSLNTILRVVTYENIIRLNNIKQHALLLLLF